ncbi:MAG TPA: DNA replication/repair protein RecF [Candidatus Scatosoma pullicola]|nr:DNA replication/repair protein RecF [Candidatus Scatosoma pullicola]
MQIKNLSLQNFRNYENETFAFDGGLNILFGKNAQGKTNCAEAVFYLCTGTSLRIRHDRQLIRIGAPCAKIAADAETRYGKVRIEADIYEDRREIRINGARISRSADLMGHINSVFFSPGELRLIQDGPDERRRFMNMSISQTSPAYYTALLRYNKILDQRNALLKNRDVDLILDTLPVWDEQLCRYASIIIKKRTEFLEKLAPYAKELHAFLTDGAEELVISPDKKYGGGEGEIAAEMLKRLGRNYEKDIRLGFTTVGPHRDDIDFFISGKDAKAYASQGQTRTAALAVKLSEVEIFRELSGEYPVLILDDVMSELDLPRRKKLLKRISSVQTILTCTHAERVLYGAECKKIRIENGRIKREKEE